MTFKTTGNFIFPIIFCLLFLCNIPLLHAQEDSLKNVLYSKLPDTTRAKAALKLSMIYSSNSPEYCLVIVDKGIQLCKTNSGCRKFLSGLLKLKGVAYVNMGEYKKSAVEYFNALKEAEAQNDIKETGAIYNNLGVNFWYQKDYKNALKYHLKSLEFRMQVGNPKEIGKSYNNLGIVEVELGNYNEAVQYYQRALQIKDSIGDKIGIANVCNNLGIVYERLNHPEDAKSAYEKALNIFREEDDKRGELVCMNNIATIYKNSGRCGPAVTLANDALKLAKELGDMEDLKTSYEILAVCSYENHDYKSAYDHLKNYLEINDSLISSENYKTVQELEKKYNTEKQEQEIKLLQQNNLIKDIELHESEVEKRNMGIIIIMALLVLGLATFTFLKIKRQKSVLEENKINIEIKNAQLEQQKKEITDSINYAKRIQVAMLKDEEHVSMHLPAHFIFYKPKDIVSGDFYWALEKEDYLYFAAADCTGHGVPGAFLTLLGTSFLNEINAVEAILTPGEILDKLRDKFVRELSQHNEKTRDGMDISMIRIHLKTYEAIWSGAFNPLWIIPSEGTQLKEITADKQPVGYGEVMKGFTDHSIQLKKDDLIFLFTDGFADQFGGSNGKKFKHKQLKSLLIENRDRSMEEQKKILAQQFETWRGHLEQVDDVLIVGMKI